MNKVIESVKLTDVQYKDLVVGIEGMGRSRKREQGKIDEADFLCGAMAVFFLLDIPVPSWPLAMIAGRKILRRVRNA